MALTIEMARRWYVEADPVHDFEHVLRVHQLAARIAQAEGADAEIVHAAALLHDSRGSAPGTNAREEHHLASALFAAEVLRAEGWQAGRIHAVQHCIRAHRFRSKGEAPQTIEAQCLFDADKLDVLGAIGVARVIAYATLAGQPVYAEPSAQFLQSGIPEAGEAHSSYHEFLFKLSKVKARLFTTTGRELAKARHDYLVDFYARLRAEISGEK